MTFVVHAVAFTVLAIKRHKKYYFCLSGTFVSLTVIYTLKFYSLVPHIPGTDLSAIIGLRILAITCTVAYLSIIARVPGSWFSRVLGRG